MYLNIIVALIVGYVVYFYWKVRKYPKGPLPLPLLGNILQIPIDDIPGYFHKMFLQYGPIYTVFMPQPTVVLMDYETIKECLVTKGEHFNGKKKEPPATLLTHMADGGILSSDGANWLEQRRTAIQILRNFGMGKSIMEDQVMRCVHDMVDHLNSLEDKSGVNMFVPLQLCVGNVINQTLFGYMNTHDNCESFLEFVHIITSLFKLFQTKFMGLYMAWPYLIKVPLINLPYKQMEKKMSKYFDFIKKEVDAQQKEFKPDAPVTTFVQAYLQKMEQQESVWLRWAMILLVKYPEIQKKAQEEIDKVVGKDRYVTMADKAMMPYVSALILELQRYANIVSGLMHESTSDQTIKGHLIPSGTVVMIQIHNVLAYDPVFENPKEFRPERFLMEDGKTFCKPLANRLVQFGMGKRQCAGEGLAKMELFLMLTTLLQKYEFHATSSFIDTKPEFGAVLMPTDHPTRIVIRC